MKTVCKENACNGCMVCIDKCPKNCISIKDSIFYYNAIKDINICIECGQCEKVCPNNYLPPKLEPVEWKQGWAQWNIRKASSSGGAASAIIKSFLDAGGYVASCLFSHGEFVFDITNDKDTAMKFSGSKYVKSNPVGIYKKVQEKLKTNRVLFIGLPCQVAALKRYVNYSENLYTIDLICHGTPSPKVLDYFFEENNIDILELKDVKFRSDSEFGINMDGTKLSLSKVTDNYLLTFLDCITYTQNCYECKFATWGRVSDITLGDSWGTDLKSEFSNGISLILCQTKKGKELLEKSEMILFDVDIENARKHNHQLQKSSILPVKREQFLNGLIQGKNFSICTMRAVPWMYFKQRIKYILIKLHILKMRGGGIE